MRLVLGGEGPTELGGWADDVAYRDPKRTGLIEALLRTIAGADLAIEEGIRWKDIRKFRSGEHRRAEQRNVLGLAQFARERGFDVLVFTRDRDRSEQREKDIEAALQTATEQMPELRIVGGVAVEAIEAFVLALLGDEKAEQHHDPKAELAQRGCVALEQKVEAVLQARMATPNAARHLELWLRRAHAALAS